MNHFFPLKAPTTGSEPEPESEPEPTFGLAGAGSGADFGPAPGLWYYVNRSIDPFYFEKRLSQSERGFHATALNHFESPFKVVNTL